MKKRRLGDLYVRGKDLSIDDGEENPVEVRLQKLNEIDREACLRRANAAKARAMIKTDDEESEVFLAAYAQVRDFADRDGLISLITATDLSKARARIEAQTATDEETWGKDGYLQGLLDAWIGEPDNLGLVSISVEDPDDPEVKRVRDEIDRFDREITEQVRAEAERLQDYWAGKDDEDIWRAAAHAMLERGGEQAFTAEYERQQLFHAVRDPKVHSKRYFASIAEVDDLDQGLRAYLTGQYNALLVDSTEGKGSRASLDSSNSSDQPEETSASSGQEAANE